MKNKAGPPVSGDDFFNRENLIEQTWDLLDTGSHILIAAPRRVGKTSLMYYLRDNPKEGYVVLYMITESINDEKEFFRLVVNKLLKTEHIKNSQKVLTFIQKHKPTIKKIGPDGVEFGISEDHDYRTILERILKSLTLVNKKLVIMFDELPKTVENIIEDSNENSGKHFLHSLRELRQDTDINNHVHFIYTGSIGLENLVSKLNAIDTINDLTRLKVVPLTNEKSKTLIQALLVNMEFNLSEKMKNFILQKIEWLIPFYIQLTILELKNIYRENPGKTVTKSMIDQAFEDMLEQRQHFEHWHTRLRASLKGKEYNFVKELLNIACENEIVSSNEVFNLAIKYQLENEYKDLVGALVYDGYINNHNDNHIYRYNSPIVRMWWRKNIAN